MQVPPPVYFRRERELRTLALRAGLPKDRAAAAAAERLASRPLDRETAERLTAHLRGRLGVAGDTDPRIVAAHTRLQQLEPETCPPLGCIRVLAMPERIMASSSGETIFISSTAPGYRAAADGDLLPLVTLLFHEGCHQRIPSPPRTR